MRRPFGPGRARLIPLLLLVALAGLMQPTAAGGSNAVLRGVVAPIRLKVMTFNIEYGGTVIDFDAIVEGAIASDADVIALNEAYRHAGRLAERAGYPYASPRLDVISRYPLLDPAGADGRYLFVQIAPGQVVAIANVHLASAPYSPRLILEGWGRKRILRNERETRMPEIRPVVKTMAPLAAAGIPSFIVGDFNAPSHLDWTRETVGLLPQMRFPVRWPVSMLLADRGFDDTYRAAHPDPLARLGTTWPAGRPRSATSWNPPPDAPHDRIDQVWVAGAATTVRSQIVGERGGRHVAIEVAPWGSDHRGVVSTVELTPGPSPVTVSFDPRLIRQGRDLTVTYHAPGGPGERVVIVPSGGDPATDAIDQMPTPGGQDVDGSVTFATGAWPPGAYDVVLSDASDAVLSRTGFLLELPGATPEVDTSRRRYREGAPITVSWSGAPGNRFDWIGINRRGDDPSDGGYRTYLYTRSAVAGSATFDRTSSKRWPLPPGRYTAWLMVADVYRAIGSANFVVT